MPIALVVLDFDGTLTDSEAHATAFNEASERELIGRLGWDPVEGHNAWSRTIADITSLSPEVAWTRHGHGVCPAATDPYVIANGAVKRLWMAHDPGLSEREFAQHVMEIHHEAYEQVPSPFRPDACALIEALRARGVGATVVTNSPRDTVASRLAKLPCTTPAFPGVRGNAGKFSVCAALDTDSRFTALPAHVEWPGLARPVELRRGHYFDALSPAWREAGTGPEGTLVVGDNFELDLAMPLALGCQVHLITRAGTMPHELRLAETMERSGLSADLVSVLARLG